jgi:8-amino-7-oxononanoate synthase
MLDFTSALYLGFTHPSVSLAPWSALTLGRPAALEEPPGAETVAVELAGLVGAETALLFPSTLHLFRDLFETVAAERALLLIDDKAYPIARWGTEHVRIRGTAMETYPHHDATTLATRARRAWRAGLRPIVVTDGLCPGCGRLAPLPELARATAEAGGELVVDDTQGLGIVGTPSGKAAPLGLHGGGTLAWYGLHAPHVWAGSSLAKAFGAPMAALLGPSTRIAPIARDGDSRNHSSPPSAAVIAAARQALSSNRTAGDLLRARLARRVSQLRAGLRRLGAPLLSALPLPVQTIALASASRGRAVLAALARRGIRALLTRPCGGGIGLTIVLTARHAAADVDYLIQALHAVLRQDDRHVRLMRAMP